MEDRLGHDRRYAIDPTKIIGELGWSPKYNFETGIKKTIAWYQENENWLKAVTRKNTGTSPKIGSNPACATRT